MGLSRRSVAVGLAVAAMLLSQPLSASSQAANSKEVPSSGRAAPWREKPEKFRLSSGLNCLFQKNTASPTTVVQIFIPGGKGAVPTGKDGLAYLATRLAVEIPDADKARALMSQATRLRVTVREDYSLISLECLSENVENAVKVASELIQDQILSGLRINHNKDLMSLLGRAGEDNPVEAGHNAALRALFRGQGYGSADFGTEESLKALAKKDITLFDGKYLTKKGLLFSISSDLGRENIAKLLEQDFAKIPPGETGGGESAPPASWPADRNIALVKDTKQTYVARVYLYPSPPGSAGSFAKAYLCEILLGKGPGSRLWDLRASGELAYSVNARTTWTKTCGILEAYLETENAKKDRAVEALDLVLRTLYEQGIQADELDMARTLARAQFLMANETKTVRTLTLGTFELLGLGVDYFSGIFEALNTVTLDDMNSFIKNVLAPETSLLVVVGGSPGKLP